MTDLFHFTCSHRFAEIMHAGFVAPGCQLLDPPRIVGGNLFAWFTDLRTPLRDALGLTSTILACDRTEHRFRVSGLANPRPRRWLDVRRDFPELHHLELAPGARPAHWWVSATEVAVVLDERAVA